MMSMSPFVTCQVYHVFVLDINECQQQNVCGFESSVSCVNTYGSYACVVGVQRKSISTMISVTHTFMLLVDFNECIFPGACGSESRVKCVNTYGSYACVVGVVRKYGGICQVLLEE